VCTLLVEFSGSRCLSEFVNIMMSSWRHCTKYIFLSSKFVIYGQQPNGKIYVTFTLVPGGGCEFAGGLWLTQFRSMESTEI
jgi:hypothetical protein